MFERIRLSVGAWMTVVGTAGTLFGIVLGYVVPDYNNFREHNRELIAQEMASVQRTHQEISLLLQNFSAQAKGIEKVNKTTVDELRSNLTRLLDQASSLRTRVPSSDPEFQQFANAMVALKNSAETMNGPLDARPFVESVSDFYQAEVNFEKTVVKAQSDYKLPLL